MFERFTDRNRRVVVLAQESARLLRHPYIGTEHLLLGLLDEGESVAALALKEVGLEIYEVQKKVIELVGEGSAPPKGHLNFTPPAKKAIELALREALELGHNFVGPEHLLLALLGDRRVPLDGALATQVLDAFDVTPREVRQAVVRRLEHHEYASRETRALWTTAPAPMGPPPPAAEGVWMAFYSDGSAARPFPTEVEALRYAVAYSCQVELTRWGQDVGRPEVAS